MEKFGIHLEKKEKKEMDINSDQLNKITTFIDHLTQFKSDSLIYNPYEFNTPCQNLKQYLIEHFNAQICLIGEAPGYLGCRLTGIPFTSGYLLSRSPFFAPNRSQYDFKFISEYKEQSAKAFFTFYTLHPSYFSKIIMWNIFPFHPHEENKEASNRKPNVKEIQIGLTYLKELFEVFSFSSYYPIGESAEKGLKLDSSFSFPFRKIRHPAHGGSNIFLKELTQVLGESNGSRIQETE
jgi:uracil-DNA glycosylase